MKAYKGFNKDMTCRGFQYEEGKTYETDEAKLCESGFHACENPLDCFHYYSPNESVYHEVEIEDNGERNIDDTKVVGKKITVGAELSVPMLCKLHFEYVKSKTTNEKQGESYANLSAHNCSSLSAHNCSSLSAQDCSSLSAQDFSSLSAKDSSSLSARNFSSLSAQDFSSLSARNFSSLSARNFSSLSAKDSSSLSAQDFSSLSAQDNSSLSAQSNSSLSAKNNSSLSAKNNSSLSAQDFSRLSAGKDSVLSCFNGECKAGIGSIISIANREWIDGEYKITDFCSAIVDGEKIKADTWYKLENGKFVEVNDND